MTPKVLRGSGSPSWYRRLRALPIIPLLLQLAACAGPSYYSQAIAGHVRLMNQREAVSDVLESASDPDLVRSLELAEQIRRFAVQDLQLPEGGSYRQFVETGQEAVTWNVVAAPEFSLEAKKWCFPVAGCVPYRGYFDPQTAQAFAGKLSARGYDVTVSPAIAYSTLGWFDDPLTDTMFKYGEEQLAALIFHEMAHQKLYRKGDTAFNEAFAGFVENTGVQLWLESTGRPDRLDPWRRQHKASMQFNALLRETAGRLRSLYASGVGEEEMKIGKSTIFEKLREDHVTLVDQHWGGRDYFASWFAKEPNNARFALMSSYLGGACAFENLFRSVGGDIEAFHRFAREKSELNGKQRKAWLGQACEVIASKGIL